MQMNNKYAVFTVLISDLSFLFLYFPLIKQTLMQSSRMTCP